MKKTTRILSVLLVVVLLITPLPFTALAQGETITPLYENSFLVTVKTASAVELKTYLGVDSCSGGRIEIHSDYVLYTVQAVVLNENLEDAMERVAALPGVTNVQRNTSAKDYWEKASYARLNTTALAIPLGQTATVKINKANLEQNEYKAIGVYVYVDPQEMPYGLLYTLVDNFEGKATVLALYEEDLAHRVFMPYLTYYHYTGIESESYFSGPSFKRTATASPVNEYLILGESLELNQRMETQLSKTSGCITVKMAYALQEIPPQKWQVENPQVVDLENAHGNSNQQFVTVTLTGKQVGETNLTLQYGDDTTGVTATCFVQVYQPSWKPPTQLGDVNGDGTIDAKDALVVLWYGANRHASLHWSVTPENLMRIEKAKWYGTVIREFGNVNGDNGISAKDALEILKYAVGKINKFPVEE